MREATVRKADYGKAVYTAPKPTARKKTRHYKNTAKKNILVSSLDKNAVNGLLAFLVLAGLVAVPYVICVGKTKINENRIAEINSEIAQLQTSNSILEREYLNKTSFCEINRSVHALGMSEAQNRITIDQNKLFK